MKCLCIRLGAVGDLIMLSSLLPLLAKDYEITLNCKQRGKEVLKNNPHIANWLIHDESIKLEELPAHWKKISEGFDKVINLTGSIETALLKHEDDPIAKEPKAVRKTDVNYYDQTMKLAGYDVTGRKPLIYLSLEERKRIKAMRRRAKKKGSFIILWALSGSALHKAYPYTEDVARYILRKYPETVFVTVGDEFCRLLEWEHSRTIMKAGKTSIRTAMLWTYASDLVIGVETGVLNAAGAHKVHKIILYSHSAHKNLSLYWDNAHPIQSPAPCSPCYLHIDKRFRDFCNPVKTAGDASLCMAMIKPEMVSNEIERVIKLSGMR